jgi:hypothetical protein
VESNPHTVFTACPDRGRRKPRPEAVSLRIDKT